MRLFLFAFLSYLAGGIPSGYVLARKLKNIDIRKHGSGNPGAANVYRVVGPAAGWACMLFDALKGYVPVILARQAFPDDPLPAMLCGALAIVGHVWTVFLGFKGGKGVATSAGVFAALMPAPAVVCFATFVAMTAATRHISAGSMAGAVVLPLAAWLMGESVELVGFASASAALVLYKHIPNLRRLLGGAEMKVHRAFLL